MNIFETPEDISNRRKRLKILFSIPLLFTLFVVVSKYLMGEPFFIIDIGALSLLSLGLFLSYRGDNSLIAKMWRHKNDEEKGLL